MPVLSIRNLPANVHTRLRLRAAQHHRSMEAEARAILTEACVGGAPDTPTPTALPDWVDGLYRDKKPAHVVKTLIADRRKAAAKE